MKTKLLITGGLGYIGSFTARSIWRQSKIRSFSIDNLSRGNIFAKKFVDNYKLCISSNRIKKIITENKINTVLHLAAFTCVRESENKTKQYLNNNYKKQIKFIDNLNETTVRYFIFASSLSIFEKNKFKKNLSPYSKYKIKIENYLKKIASKNFKVVILRYSNVVGSDRNGSLGEKNSHINRIVPTFYNNIKHKKNNILFFDFKKKTFPFRNYIHVIDVANINLKMLSNYKKIYRKFSVFNIFNIKYFSNYEVLKNLSNILKIKYKFKLKQISSIESIKPTYKSGKNIFKYLNYKPRFTDLKKILKTNIKWFSKIY